MRKLALHWQIAIGMLAGAMLGVAVNLWGGDGVAELWGGRFQLLGGLVLRMLKMVAVPLVITSLASGVLGLGGAAHLGRMFSRTLLYYLATSMIAILTGLVAVNLIRPGLGGEPRQAIKAEGVGGGGLGEVIFQQIENRLERVAPRRQTHRRRPQCD